MEFQAFASAAPPQPALAASRFQLWQTGKVLAEVPCQPLLEVWEKEEKPAMQRMRTYQRELLAAVGPLPDSIPLALQLEVHKPAADLLRHYDLDNYLYPLTHARHGFGHQRFAYATACKGPDLRSRLRIGEAVPAAPDLADFQHFACRAGRGCESPAWKIGLRSQLAATAAEAPPGPMVVHVAWRCGAVRNWATLWKPTIDAMGPVLGAADPAKPFDLADGRITELHLHVAREAALGSDVEVAFWWRAAS